MPVNGWSRGAGIYPAASDRSITQAGGWNAPLLFLVVSAVVARQLLFISLRARFAVAR